MSRGRSSFGASMAAFGLAALFAWASSASAALTTTKDTTGPVGSVDDRAPASPTSVKAEANIVELQVEVTWGISVDDFVRQSPAGGDFTSGGTFIRTNDVASYQIWRRTLGGDYALIGTVDAGQNSYVDTGAESGVSYTYEVTAVDGGGNASAPVESETVNFGPPGEATTELPPDVPPLAQAVTMRFDKVINVNDKVAVDAFVVDFKQLLADLLGIPITRIVIKAVRTGSTIVDFEIAADANNPAADVVAQLNEAVKTDPQVFADAGLGALIDYQTAQTTTVAFGNVQSGASASKPLAFTNSSTDSTAVLIVSTSLQGAGFSVSPDKLSLSSGQSGSIAVSFAAASVGNVNGSYTGTLVITTNDSKNPRMEIALSATVAGGLSNAVADVSTTSIKFPRTKADTSASRSLVIHNKGGLSLGVNVGITGANVFQLSKSGAATIAGGDSLAITVTFSPSDTLSYTASIAITTDDAAHPSFAVAVSGIGESATGTQVLRDPQGNQIYGDFDGNATINFDDFFMFADGFGLTSASPNWDVNLDLIANGKIDFDDFFKFADNFGKSGTYVQ